MRLWQYSARTEPVSQSGETITPDKWTPSITPPQANWARAARYSLAALVAATILGDVPRAETITMDKWFSEAQRPRWDRPRNQYLHQTLSWGTTTPAPAPGGATSQLLCLMGVGS